MPCEYPSAISCPRCGEPNIPRHCVTNTGCGWYWCMTCQLMVELGERRKARRWAVRKARAWTNPR